MNRYLNPIIHLIVFAGILLLPIVAIILSPGQYHLSNTINYFLANLVNFSLYLFVFYVAVPALLKKGKHLQFYFGVLSLTILSGFVKLGCLHLVQNVIPSQVFTITLGTNLGGQLFFITFMSLFFAVLGAFLRFTVDWFKNQQQMLKLELELKKAELAMLKYQMYPHFLFNTLNNIYALSKKSDPMASESMAKLSDILRYILYQSKEGMVKIEDDLDILKSFIDLELLRKDDPAYLKWTQEGKIHDFQLPPMLLLPLVENAFKHGAGNKIPVIEVFCKLENDMFRFIVVNSKGSTASSNIEASGIGLANVRKRLELSYPGNSELIINESKDSFSASIIISIRS